jgi:hypothetical protein
MLFDFDRSRQCGAWDIRHDSEEVRFEDWQSGSSAGSLPLDAGRPESEVG